MAEENTTAMINTTTTTLGVAMIDCSERDKLNIPIHLLRASVVNWYLLVVIGTIGKWKGVMVGVGEGKHGRKIIDTKIFS